MLQPADSPQKYFQEYYELIIFPINSELCVSLSQLQTFDDWFWQLIDIGICSSKEF